MSSNNLLKEKSHIFKGRILEFEKVLVEYHLKIADLNSESKKVALLGAYLSIHGELTQRQLKELTKFSISTISTNLMNLINAKYIKRKMKPGTHEYVYFLAPVSQNAIDQVLGSLKLEINFLKMKISELEEIHDSNKKGYTLLLSRLKETVRTFQLYHKIIDVIQNPDLTFDFEKLRESEIILEDLQFLEEYFDPELKKIEEDILDFFIHQSTYSILKRFNLIILVLFITRKVLTQEKLRKLTGLSLGKVSQVLKKLLDMKYIEKVEKKELQKILPREKTLKIHYVVVTVQKSFMMSGINSLLELLKWEEKFKAIYFELEGEKQKFKNLNGYEEISKIINNHLKVIPLYKRAYDFFSKIVG